MRLTESEKAWLLINELVMDQQELELSKQICRSVKEMPEK